MHRLIIALLLIITLKIACVLMLGPAPIEGDAAGYWRLSTLVMHGDILMMGEPIAYRTPVYPWLLAAVRFVSPYPRATLIVLQGLMWGATILLAARLAESCTRQRGTFALTLLLSLPMLSAITFAATALTETLFVALLMAHLTAVWSYQARATMGRALLCGVSLGLMILTRPIAMHLWVADLLLLGVLWWCGRDCKPSAEPDPASRLRPALLGKHFLVAAVTVIAMLSPWLRRNHQLFGKAMLTEFVGRNLWIVTYQDGSGAGLSLPSDTNAQELKDRLRGQRTKEGWMLDDERWRMTWPVSNSLVHSGLDDAEADRLMRRVAMQSVKENKFEFAKKAVRRTFNFWRTAATDLPQQGDGRFDGEPGWGANIIPLRFFLDYRFSQSVAGNTALMFLTMASCLWLLLRPGRLPLDESVSAERCNPMRHEPRAFALWIATVLVYFSLITGILEIPAYRYRIVIEPLVLCICSTCIATLCLRPTPPSESE